MTRMENSPCQYNHSGMVFGHLDGADRGSQDINRSGEEEVALIENEAFSLPNDVWEEPSSVLEAIETGGCRSSLPPQGRTAAGAALIGEGGKLLDGVWLFCAYDDEGGESEVETDSTRNLV